MALVKRGRFWYFDFVYRGKHFQGTTDQTNRNIAKLVEAKVRSDAALEHFGIAAPKDAPMLKDFLEGAFLADVRKHCKKPGTVQFYVEHVARLLKHKPFADLRLNQVDAEILSRYSPRASVATINGDLGTLRKALRLAKEWRLIAHPVKVRMLPGARQRKFVLDGELENRYLALAEYPLKHAAILILDFGLRPEEAVCLRKADIVDKTLIVWEGKTPGATCAFPLTDRAQNCIDELCALWPKSEWLFPGKKGRHYTRKALDNLHAKVRKEHRLPAEFVLYSLRHTFGTRLDEAGASPFEIRDAMRHTDLRTTNRYIHPSGDHLTLALKRKEVLDRTLRGEAVESLQLSDIADASRSKIRDND